MTNKMIGGKDKKWKKGTKKKQTKPVLEMSRH